MKTIRLPLAAARARLLLLFAFAFLYLCPTVTIASPGDFDDSFGLQGVAMAEFATTTEAKVVLVQPDGKIIAAGAVRNPANASDYDFAIVRFNADGSPDGSFGAGGRVTTSLLGFDLVRAGVLQPDGKIVLAGTTSGRFGFARYHPDGSLDAGFGDGGKVIADFNDPYIALDSVLLQPDGKILALGNNDRINLYLARLHANGSLDASFGAGGKMTAAYNNQFIRGRSAVLQPDGKILIGGEISQNGEPTENALFRFDAGGSFDTTFNGSGVWVHPLGVSHDRIYKIFLQPDGKILSVGTSVNAQANMTRYALVRYSADGSIDPSFGTGGIVYTPLQRLTHLGDALVDAENRIVVASASYSSDYSRPRFHLARFKPDGSLDATFGNGGRANLPVGYSSWAYALARQPDDKIVVAGTGRALDLPKYSFAVVRVKGGNGPVPTAGSISGRVVNDGPERGVGGVTVVLSGGSLAVPLRARTNPFGFYRFNDLPVGVEYTLRVESKKTVLYSFGQTVRLLGHENAEELVHNFDGIR